DQLGPVNFERATLIPQCASRPRSRISSPVEMKSLTCLAPIAHIESGVASRSLRYVAHPTAPPATSLGFSRDEKDGVVIVAAHGEIDLLSQTTSWRPSSLTLIGGQTGLWST